MSDGTNEMNAPTAKHGADDTPETRELQADERMYTGEPVETDDGTYRPQQMNVGAENMQGAGEWPDPHTPPKPGSVGDADRTSRGDDDAR